ncbi:MAG: hypothetical protein ACO3CU_04310 [Candidatus Nanopelagicales bacterium]
MLAPDITCVYKYSNGGTHRHGGDNDMNKPCTVIAIIKGKSLRWTGSAKNHKDAKRQANAAFGVKRSWSTTFWGQVPEDILAEYAPVA